MRPVTVTTDPFTGRPLVILQGPAGDTVALCVGACEAAAIAAELNGVGLERPNTHQLTCELLAGAGATVCGAEITDVTAESFQAQLWVELPDGERACHPARPSDAIAIAMCAGAAIRVDARVVAVCGGAEPVCPGSLDDGALPVRLADEHAGSWKM